MTVRSTWFITGAAGGIGRELTEQLLARGDRVAAALRRPALLDGLAATYRDRLWVRALDVTDTAQMREVVNAAFAELGRIDVVVSNAGHRVFGAAEELSDEQIERQLRTNLDGSIQLARAVVPHLRAQGGGRLVQLSGMGGRAAFPGLSVYHATIRGIEGFYEALSAEVASFGIRTILVELGTARTGTGSPSAETVEPAQGDQGRMARQVIITADAVEPPARLLLGSDVYARARAALTERLALVDSQRELARSTDLDGYGVSTIVTSTGRVGACA